MHQPHQPHQPLRSKLPLILLITCLLPFVVGFDLPDSSGTYLKVGTGRGAYHLSGCKRAYDSEIVEGNIAMRATLNTEGEGTTFWSRVQPKRTTFGVFGNFTTEEMVLTDTGDGVQDGAQIGDKFSDHGMAGGLYAGFDWSWVGLQLGLAGYSLLQKTPAVDEQGGSPMLSLRAGPEWLHASFEAFGGTPLYTGGGFNALGVGGRLGSTRLWGGLAGGPYRETMVSFKGSQGLGPVTVFAAGMLGTANPPGQVIDQEYGMSVGVEARLPSFR